MVIDGPIETGNTTPRSLLTILVTLRHFSTESLLRLVTLRHLDPRRPIFPKFLASQCYLCRMRSERLNQPMSVPVRSRCPTYCQKLCFRLSQKKWFSVPAVRFPASFLPFPRISGLNGEPNIFLDFKISFLNRATRFVPHLKFSKF